MKKIVLLFLILFSVKSFSQDTSGEKELGVWYMYGGSHRVADNWKIKTLAHFRFFNIGDDLRQLMLRAGVNYRISDNFGALVGYSFFNTDNTFDVDGGEVNEHRIYEDLYLSNKINKLGLAHRLRAEQRFFNSTTGHFLRYQLALSHPLGKKWSVNLYDEVFFDFTGEAYNQNWLGASFKYSLSNTTKLQLGYQNISVNDGPTFNRILLGISISTDHRKKK